VWRLSARWHARKPRSRRRLSWSSGIVSSRSIDFVPPGGSDAGYTGSFALLARDLPAARSLGLEAGVSRLTYLLDQAEIVPRYLWLSVWPRELVFDYGVMQATTIGAVWPGALLIGALFVATVIALLRRPDLGFWGAWFFITLAPASSLVPVSTEVGAERRMYLPLIGVINILILAVYLGASRWVSSLPLRRRLLSASTAAVLAALSAVAFARNNEYRSGLSIWQTVVDRRPHWRAHEHLSIYLQDAGRLDAAIGHLRVAAPQSANAHHALAAALLERGDVEESIAQFREFVRMFPRDPAIGLARKEYASALRRAGDHGQAIEQLRLVIAVQPGDVRAHLALADALKQSGDLQGAISEYAESERLEPGNVVALANLGVLLASQGRTDEAMAALRRTLEIEPRQSGARLQLVQLLLAARRLTDAEAEARALLALVPDNADGHNLLGVSLANQNRLEPASQEFTEALRLNPEHPDARANLARTNQILGGR
jgi:protein O-mannosyl-transferase